jgi:hypothetical protein
MDREPTKCKSCGAPIFYCTYPATGKAAPFDAAPAEDGNALLEGDTYRLLIPRDRAAYTGQLHKSHFATCPHAAQHAKAPAHAAR